MENCQLTFIIAFAPGIEKKKFRNHDHNFFFLLCITEANKNNTFLYKRRLVIIKQAAIYHYATVTQLNRGICGGGAAGGCYATARAHTETGAARRGRTWGVFSRRKLHNMTSTCLNAD